MVFLSKFAIISTLESVSSSLLDDNITNYIYIWKQRVAGAETNCDKIMPDGLLGIQWAVIEYSIQVTRGWKLENFGGSSLAILGKLVLSSKANHDWFGSLLAKLRAPFFRNWMKILNLSLTNWGAYSRMSMDRFDKLINFFGAKFVTLVFLRETGAGSNPCQIVESPEHIWARVHKIFKTRFSWVLTHNLTEFFGSYFWSHANAKLQNNQ